MKTYNVCLSNFKKLIFAICLIYSSSISFAASKKLEIVIDLSNDASLCGIEKQWIKTSSILTLRNNKIEYSSDSTEPWLYVKVGMLKLNHEYCVFHINARISQGQKQQDRNGFKSHQYEELILCESSFIGGENSKSISKTVYDTVEDSIKVCLSKIDY